MDLKRRLNSIIQKDKETNPKYLINIIKSDFFYMISNYFEVDFDDITVDIGVEESKYSIKINCLGDRMKLMKTLPE
ncbi:MAG TPA: cell division topological specificity factor MinE [Candidatus Onthoplasma faecigallinarum]|nr:cell division topological specificity factor MinE [Candidatus Onthoplasma faecigallinarum]